MRSIRTLDHTKILEGQTRRPEAWSPQSRTVPHQHSYHALMIQIMVVPEECSVAKCARIGGTGVAVTSRRPAMLAAVFSSQVTHSSVKTTYSGKIKIATAFTLMAACPGMGPHVMGPNRVVCIHGTTILMATLAPAYLITPPNHTSYHSSFSPVQTSQTR